MNERNEATGSSRVGLLRKLPFQWTGVISNQIRKAGDEKLIGNPVVSPDCFCSHGIMDYFSMVPGWRNKTNELLVQAPYGLKRDGSRVTVFRLDAAKFKKFVRRSVLNIAFFSKTS